MICLGQVERGAVISKRNFNTVFDILPSAVLGCATEDNLRTLVQFGAPARIF